MSKKVTRGCVVFMKASSGLTDYGNGQCVSGVCEQLGTISLFDHNQNYSMSDIDRIAEYSLQAELDKAQKRIIDYEQTEASVCPEDVGIKEYNTENKQLQEELTDKDATINHLRKKAEFDMPVEMRGHFHNGQCPDPCDMVDGPCACGATHNAKEWLGKLIKRIEQLQSKLDSVNHDYTELLQERAEYVAENKRLRKRDGNATIQLCFNDGDNPFAREDLQVVDVGVSDNCYVVESQTVSNLQGVIKWLREVLEKHRWIPIEEGLPKITADYLTMIRYPKTVHATPVVDLYCVQDGMWGSSHPHTHWKPIILPGQEVKV